MDTINLRSAATYLARSQAVIVCAVFIIVLAPILVGLAVSASQQNEPTWETLYQVAIFAPAAGMIVALIMLIVVLWRRSRPTLRIDTHVYIPRSGVRFLLTELNHLQLYSRPEQGTFLALLPEHVTAGVTDDPLAVADYIVSFPKGATPRPFELVDLIQARVPHVGVDKLGTLQ